MRACGVAGGVGGAGRGGGGSSASRAASSGARRIGLNASRADRPARLAEAALGWRSLYAAGPGATAPLPFGRRAERLRAPPPRSPSPPHPERARARAVSHARRHGERLPGSKTARDRTMVGVVARIAAARAAVEPHIRCQLGPSDWSGARARPGKVRGARGGAG